MMTEEQRSVQGRGHVSDGRRRWFSRTSCASNTRPSSSPSTPLSISFAVCPAHRQLKPRWDHFRGQWPAQNRVTRALSSLRRTHCCGPASRQGSLGRPGSAFTSIIIIERQINNPYRRKKKDGARLGGTFSWRPATTTTNNRCLPSSHLAEPLHDHDRPSRTPSIPLPPRTSRPPTARCNRPPSDRVLLPASHP